MWNLEFRNPTNDCNLEGYFRYPGFVRDSGNRKISWLKTGFDSYPGRGFYQNLDAGCGNSFACLSETRAIVRGTWGSTKRESSGVFSPISSPSLFLPLFLLLFLILWYERLFRFCSGLKTCVNSKYQSKGSIFILHLLVFTLCLVFFNLNILETRDGICENDEKE